MIRETFYQYIKLEKRYSLHTLSAYKSDLSQFEGFIAESYGIDHDTEISYAMIRSWLASLIENGISARSVNRKLSSLKAYYRFLRKEGLISENPLGRASSLNIPTRLPVFATMPEIEHALATRSNGTPFEISRDLLIMEILYCTGIRLSELINLRISDVDNAAGTIKVTGKRNKQRIIPVTPQLLQLIEEYLELRSRQVMPNVAEIIVTDKGKKSYPVFIYRKVRHYLGIAGLKGVRSPHVLRHTFATHMLNEGADLNAIKELLGHSSLAATQVYTHLSVEKLKSIYKHAHPRA